MKIKELKKDVWCYDVNGLTNLAFLFSISLEMVREQTGKYLKKLGWPSVRRLNKLIRYVKSVKEKKDKLWNSALQTLHFKQRHRKYWR